MTTHQLHTPHSMTSMNLPDRLRDRMPVSSAPILPTVPTALKMNTAVSATWTVRLRCRFTLTHRSISPGVDRRWAQLNNLL